MPRSTGSSQRLLRINDAIKRELATLLQQEARDPRFKHVTLIAVDVVRDLSLAKVYISLTEDDATVCKDIVKALNNKAAGYLRSLLSARIDLRTTPRLQFIHDTSIAYGNHMTNIINQAIAQDRLGQPEE